MPKNKNLCTAKLVKNDEFYTLMDDVDAEMSAYLRFDPDVFCAKTVLCPCDDPERSSFACYFREHFEALGLKRLICTCLAQEPVSAQLSLFDAQPADTPDDCAHHGKLMVMDAPDKIHCGALTGNGDFRSAEVTALRDQADMLITNVPFSLANDAVSWALASGKHFAFIISMNAVTNINIFPRIQAGDIWLGATKPKRFLTPSGAIQTLGNVCWITNIDHGARHEPLALNTMAHNLARNEPLKRVLREKYGQAPEHLHYERYINYDALEVPFLGAIPSDYAGVMGVPLSILERLNPAQFEVIGSGSSDAPEALGIQPMGDTWLRAYRAHGGTGNYTSGMRCLAIITEDGRGIAVYKRILVRNKHPIAQ